MTMPKWWTECHEEVSVGGELGSCNSRPIVGLRIDPEHGEWYPVCVEHVREPMADLWRVVFWAGGEPVPAEIERQLVAVPPNSETGADRG